MTNLLQGRRSLVIGGASGIGYGTAEALLKEGADVVIAGRTEKALKASAEKLKPLAEQHGGRIRSIVCDAMSGRDVRAAVEFAEEGQGLDCAVTVPGGGHFTPVLGFGDDEFSEQVDANIRPQYLTLKYAGLSMVRAGHGGSIVMVSSTAAAFSCRYLASYAAGKAAVNHLVRVAADELGEKGIRVNAVAPGLTLTATTEGMTSNPELVKQFLQQQPLARLGRPEDQANMIRFLLGPESDWITGQVIEVDGGHTLRSFPESREMMKMIFGEEKLAAVERGEILPE